MQLQRPGRYPLLPSPATEKELGATFEQAMAELRYGTSAVNAWTGVGI